MKRLAGIAIAAMFCAGVAPAQDRPDESDMFGAPAAAPAATAPNTAPASAPSSRSKDESRELVPNIGRDAFASGEVTDNALTIGGIFYQRWIASHEDGGDAKHDPISMPLQFDAFLDARPNDQIRGYVQERLLYDPTRDQFGNPTSGSGFGSQQFSSTSGAPQSLSTTTASTPNNPQLVLDQAWIKFDIDRAVFVTAGKQHVKWGVSRFWNPTDFLSTQRRDPLLPYDLRLGNTMVKFALPFERKGTNLYAITLLDNPQPASTLGQLGEAVRFETLLGNAEVGVEALTRGNEAPTFGADVSAPLGPFDVYAEAALYEHAPTPTYNFLGAPAAGQDVSTIYSVGNLRGPLVQASGGITYEFGWRENRQATLGAEYFYNQLGYNKANIYPVLIFLGQYQPFYTGKHYAAVYLTAEGPDELKHTSYTFSTLSNLSDGSAISRVDFSWRLLTYLTFEAYADYHYGTRGGEFNFALNTPALTFNGNAIPPVNLSPTLYDVGMGLRLSF